MSKLNINWRLECIYCVNRENCKYKEKVKEYKNQLIELNKQTKGIYGSTKFNCDYFVCDTQKYINENWSANNCG